ncbi:hypothetical protein [Paenibacillus periandrae]|nr:hypothetical protein [Paenibacillus periandrae]
MKLDEIKGFIHDFKGERLRFSRIIWPLRSLFTGLLAGIIMERTA